MARPTTIAALAASITMLTSAGLAIDDHAAEEGAMDPAMMEAWKELATPGEHQAMLAKRQGLWSVTVRHWPAPGAPTQESTGKAQFRMELGGRFLIQVYESAFAGQPFRGIGMTGYDNKTQRLQFNWMDNMSTSMMQGEGVMKGDVFHWNAKATDPLKGRVSMRGTETFSDPNSFTAEMFSTGPDGQEFKSMQLDYVRMQRGGHSHGDHDHGHEHGHGDHDHGHEHGHGDHDHGHGDGHEHGEG